MKWKAALSICLSLVLGTGGAMAASDAPPPRTGFQLALRTGAAVPLGYVSATTAMSDALSIQVPLIVDIGAKPIRHLFIGAFLGAALGGASGAVADSCKQLGVNCYGLGFRGGILAEANLRPGEPVNPWLGAGFGYEIGGSSGSNERTSISNSVRGFEYLHVLGGADFRLQDYFGVGPFIDAAIGKYDFAESRTNQGGLGGARGGDVSAKAFHAWLILGVRVVMLP